AYGDGARQEKDCWLSLLGQLVANGFLMPDPGGHGGLAIAEKGHALGRGEVPFQYRVETRTRAARRAARAGQTPQGENVDASLLAALKTLRLRLAKEREVAAHGVFLTRPLLASLEARSR